MKVRLFADLSVHENAAYYYNKAKEARKKAERLEEEIRRTEEEIRNYKQKEVVFKRKKEWYEKFHYSFTHAGRLILAGRDAHQNDVLVKNYMEEGDLFFHADVQGAAAVILKGGVEASREEREEAAQIAACYSKAWKMGYSAVDVFCAKKEQLSKYAQGMFVGKGGFVVKGEREWFRQTPLLLKIGLKEGRVVVLPAKNPERLEKMLLLAPSSSGKEKGKLAKSLAKRFDAGVDELLSLLPNGRSATRLP